MKVPETLQIVRIAYNDHAVRPNPPIQLNAGESFVVAIEQPPPGPPVQIRIEAPPRKRTIA